ncbi:ornithine cyclodeaminase family protein [Clostridium sp. CTA-7]
MDIVVLREEDMKNIFTMADAIQADKDALEIYSRNGADIPLRVNINVPESEGQSLYMPGYAADTNALGVKIVSVYPKNIEKGLTSVPATMVLVNNETGEVCSLMDGTFLTRIRTGAVSGAATDILARKDSKIFALFGTGGQAEAQLEAVLNVRDIELVKVYDISEERRNDFVKRMTENFGEKFSVKIEAAQSSDEAIADADIITVVTTSKKPVFNGKLVKKGAHVNGVGSYTPDMQEIDENLVCNSKVYVDTRNGVFNESGDLIIPVNKGIYSFDKVVGELGEVILNKVKGRESEDEITFFKTVGSSVLDVVTARRIYEKALENKVGEIVKL